MKLPLFALLLFGSICALAQVGIGTSAPHASAVLEVQSTQKGLLIPRMSSTDRNAITSPATGLLIFNSTTSSFQYYTGASWAEIGLSSVSNANVDANAAIAFSKLNISASDIQGLTPYSASTGLTLNSGAFAIDNSVVTSNYSGSAVIGLSLSAGGSGDASAILAATSTTKGFLPPRMTAAQKAAIQNPVTGLLIYQTDGAKGIYAFDGSSWHHQSEWYSNTATTPSLFSQAKPSNIDATGAVANIGVGSGSLAGLTTGDNNVAFGVNALNDLITSGNSTAIGYGALSAATGSGNTALGYTSGATNIAGSNNTFIGNQANAATSALSNATAIGYGAEVSASNTIQLGNGSVTNVNTSGGITTGGSIGVGTTSPNSSAILELSSTSKGFLPPRLTQNQINSLSPVIGLVAYNSTTNYLQVYKRGSESVDVNNSFQNMTSATDPDGFFQSFTVVNSGKLSSFDFYLRNPSSSGSSTVYCVVYSGTNYSGTPLAISDTITPTSSSNYNWGKIKFNNNNLINVTAGDVMTVRVVPIGNTSNYTWVGVGPDVYAGGSMGWTNGGFNSSYDASFKSYITSTSWVDL